MTPRQARFVEEYLIDLNGVQAAIRAGYSPNGADVTAVRLLDKASVAAAIERRKARRAAKSGITQERVLEELSSLAFSKLTDYHIDDAGNVTPAPGRPASVMAAIQSLKRKDWSDGEGGHTVEVELKLYGKVEPLKLVGRHIDLKGVTADSSVDEGKVDKLVEKRFDELVAEARKRLEAKQAIGARVVIDE